MFLHHNSFWSSPKANIDGNGAFTEALIEGLSGKADLFGNGTITIKTLDAYFTAGERTQRGQAITDGRAQSMPDFPIGVTK